MLFSLSIESWMVTVVDCVDNRQLMVVAFGLKYSIVGLS